MNPKVSVIIVSHEKPAFVKQAIYSVLAQTLEDWQAIVVDSGKLLRAGFFREFQHDERLIFEESGGLVRESKDRNMHSSIVNRLLCSGHVTGELIFLLCDDDWFYPWAFQCMWGWWAHDHKARLSIYASEHIGRSDESGKTEIIGERLADVERGKHCGGPGLDCQVDYLQFAFSNEALRRYRKNFGDTIFSERLEDKGHADGIFMERMGELGPVGRVGYFIGMNRRTPQSVNCGTR